MDDLDKLRNEIDYIDQEMVKLFEKRMETVLKIAEYKKRNHMPIFHKDRETEVIKKNIEQLKNKSLQEATEEFFKKLMEISRGVQKEQLKIVKEEKEKKEKSVIVGFQGVEGSFSEQALIEYFGEKVTRKNVREFKDIFESLKNDEIHYGVLPIENSSTGGIAEVYDLLRQYGFYIIGEKSIKVEHHLLGVKGTKIEDIKEVYSHPQAFSQSSEFFKKYENLKLIPYKNTAMSAKLIKDENTKVKAAVASDKAAKLYDLDIIESNINYNRNNYTRFIIIGKNLELHINSNKISVVVATPHRAGALYSILRYFAENGLNMLKIESRPMINKSWEYFFYIDFQGNLNEEVVRKSIDLIKKGSSFFQMLGNYKEHNR
ncbi:MAG: chorismate mutase [Marinisporobacter sp.]|jgi:chorismate mutase/prephenate dehydratase|nr:chorismate mutase [Marinisporobacter sp.]